VTFLRQSEIRKEKVSGRSITVTRPGTPAGPEKTEVWNHRLGWKRRQKANSGRTRGDDFNRNPDGRTRQKINKTLFERGGKKFVGSWGSDFSEGKRRLLGDIFRRRLWPQMLSEKKLH